MREVELQRITDQVRLAARPGSELDLGRRYIQVACKDQPQRAMADLVAALMIRKTVPAQSFPLGG
jgi:hypothetical protein